MSMYTDNHTQADTCLRVRHLSLCRCWTCMICVARLPYKSPWTPATVIQHSVYFP